MASACINNTAMSPDTYIDYPPPKCPSYNWPSPSPSLSLSLSPRVSFSHDCTPEEEASSKSRDPEKSDPGGFEDFVGFEFPLEDPGMMLAADELFYEGKLVPLKLSTIRESVPTNSSDALLFPVNTPKMHHHRRPEIISPTDPYLFSPKAPSCSMIRWKEILRLKKLYQSRNAKPTNEDNQIQMLHNHKTTTTTTSSLSSPNETRNSARSLKHFLRRTPKSSSNTEVSSHNLPLLNDSENESSLSISSRLSLSSSSSGHSHEDLPRLSLDSDNNKQTNTTTTITTTNIRNNAAQLQTNLARARRAVKQRSPPEPAPPPPPPTAINVSAESPRMNSSGKIVFHSLERSSSSPSTFNGGPRHKHRGIERSYSANVRFTPVLNVPVCSGVFGRSLFASQPRKENNVSATGGSGGANRSSVVKNRMDRT